ncbi:MAG: S8 family serine peptidase [Bacteroidales bacterium]
MKAKKIMPLVLAGALGVGFQSCSNEVIDIKESSVANTQSEMVRAILSDSRAAYMSLENVETNSIYVKLRNPLSASALEARNAGIVMTGLQEIDAIAQEIEVVEMKRVFRHAGKFEARHQAWGLDRWYKVTFTGDASLAQSVYSYSRSSEVEFVQTIQQPSHLAKPSERFPNFYAGLSQESSPYATILPANDPHLPKQWHYGRMQDSEWAREGADISLYDAWKINAGDRSVVVAIVDTGVKFDHPDLADNMWINEGEIPGNGIDDDNNGYIDDYYGFNFAINSGTIIGESHGTHVAGTVSATNNNGIGVGGVAGGTGKGDGVRIMSCQISSNNTWGGQPEAFTYSADMGAVISQNSWGYTQAGFRDKTVEDAMDYFNNAQRPEGSPMQGGMIYFASGNSNSGATFFPGAYNFEYKDGLMLGCYAVSSTDYNMKKADYSNYGSQYVDLSAPGGSSVANKAVLSTDVVGTGYSYKEGTSMACPHVSGIAALVVSHHKGNIDPMKAHELIIASAKSLQETEPQYASAMGVGLVDALGSLAEDDHTPPVAIENLALEESFEQYYLNWTSVLDPNDGVAKKYQIIYHSEPITASNWSSAYKVVTYSDNSIKQGQNFRRKLDLTEQEIDSNGWYIAIIAEDKWGNKSELSNEVSLKLIDADEVILTPNVVVRKADLIWGADFKNKKTVRVYNSAKRLVAEMSLGSTNGIGTKTIDFSNLPTGSYTIVLESTSLTREINFLKK